MVLTLARSILEHRGYDPAKVREAHHDWYRSHPFDCGMTIGAALAGSVRAESQANGALMRVSPIGIFGAGYAVSEVGRWAMQDAAITHPHPICVQANALFAMALAHAIGTGCEPEALYNEVVAWSNLLQVELALRTCLLRAAQEPPEDFVTQQGWVLIAFQNAFWQLLHATTLEKGVVDTVRRGGDTDTNAAICGALLGAVYGIIGIPEQWRKSIANCRPRSGVPGVRHPRPERYWPCDAEALAQQLLML